MATGENYTELVNQVRRSQHSATFIVDVAGTKDSWDVRNLFNSPQFCRRDYRSFSCTCDVPGLLLVHYLLSQALKIHCFQNDFLEQQALIHQFKRNKRLRSLAASFVLTTYDENVNQFNIDGMGLERFQELMKAYAMQSHARGAPQLLDSRSKVDDYTDCCMLTVVRLLTLLLYFAGQDCFSYARHR